MREYNGIGWKWPQFCRLVGIMAVVIEIPLKHPARKFNPYHYALPEEKKLKCPLGCEAFFDQAWKLDLHMLENHPNAASGLPKKG